MAKAAIGMNKPDKKWQAECDLRTLIQAKEIQANAARMKAAQAAAKEEAKKAAQVAKSMTGKGKK